MNKKHVMPTTVLLLSILVMIALHLLLPIRLMIPSPWDLAGIAPMVLGILLNLRADREMHQAKTTVKPFEISSTLITGGVYRISRNPMYLGFVLILAGTAILLGSVTPFFIVLIFTSILRWLYIQPEEGMLSATFGGYWMAYAAKTRRWL